MILTCILISSDLSSTGMFSNEPSSPPSMHPTQLQRRRRVRPNLAAHNLDIKPPYCYKEQLRHIENRTIVAPCIESTLV